MVVTPEPEADARRHAAVAFGEAAADGRGGWQVGSPGFATTFTTPGAYRERFGAAACQPLGRSRFYGAIGVRVDDVAAVARHAAGLGSRVVTQEGGVQGLDRVDGLTVLIPDLNTLLTFRA